MSLLRPTRQACSLIFALHLLGQAPAERPAEPLQDELLELLKTPLEISSTRKESVIYTPSTVSVLTREMLDRYGIQTLAQAIDLVPGMSVHRTIFHSEVPTSRGVLQEGYANRVLLLINGIPTWNAMTGDLCLPRVDIHDIERIEVLRGPASVLYGTNAYAGAINLILRRRMSQKQLDVGLASRGRTEGGASLSHSWGEAVLFAAANRSGSRGLSQGLRGEGGSFIHLEDFRQSRNASLSLTQGGHAFLANAFEVTAPLMGSTFTGPSGGGRDLQNKGWLASYQFGSDLSKRFRMKYGFSFDGSQRLFTGSQDQTRSYLQRGARLTHTLMGLWSPSSAFGLEFGAAHETRENAHYTLFNPSTGGLVLEVMPRGLALREQSVYLQANFAQGRWSALLGSRYTRNDNFGSNLSSRATAVLRLSEQQSVKVIWGQSFRAPAFLEQYMAIPQVAYGSTALNPETSTTLELAYIAAVGHWFFQVLGYDSAFRNKLYRLRRYPLFIRDPADPSVIYQNGAAFRGRGLEVEARYQQPSGLGLFLNLDYTRGDRGDEYPGSRGYNYKFVPALNARAGISQRWSLWTLSGYLQRQDATHGPTAPLPGYTAVNASLQHLQVLQKVTLKHQLIVQNADGQERWFPEYTRRNANAVPEGLGRQAKYTLSILF